MKLLAIISTALAFYWLGVSIVVEDLQPKIDKYEKERSKSKVFKLEDSTFQYEKGKLYEVEFKIEGKDTIVVMNELVKIN